MINLAVLLSLHDVEANPSSLPQRRHKSGEKKHECKLKVEDDEIIFMGSNGAAATSARSSQQPTPTSHHLPHPSMKPSFAPLPANAGPPRLPAAASKMPTNHQQLAAMFPTNSQQYLNLMKAMQNQNLLRNHL